MDVKTMVERLSALGVLDDTDVNFCFRDSADVLHYTGDYVDQVLQESDILNTLAEAITSPQFRSNWIVDQMNDETLLPEWDEEEYENQEEFEEAVNEAIPDVLSEYWLDYGWLDTSLIQYDYKRGRCELSCDLYLPFSTVRDNQDEYWPSCEVTVNIPDGGVMTFNI